MTHGKIPLPRNWAGRTPTRRYADAGPTLEAIDRLMDGILIPPPMKEFIQILMAKGVLQPVDAERAAKAFLKGLPEKRWGEPIAAQRNRPR